MGKHGFNALGLIEDLMVVIWIRFLNQTMSVFDDDDGIQSSIIYMYTWINK